ncbi:MAG: T9SS type A sorting domain-containing protein [Crocinitomicaceae bacterium]|nr:T9SS type A sorting domain-containing protein [Crocinitomicaceae bacterium]
MKNILLFFGLFFSLSVFSQVNYVDIADTTITPIGGDFDYNLDLNSDGMVDFVINLNGSSAIGYIQFEANSASSNQVLEAGLGEAKRMQCQDSVNDFSSQWNSLTSALPIITYLQGSSFGSQFNGGVVDGYLGVRFFDSTSLEHYAWIRVDVPDTIMSITIKDFAYTSNTAGIQVCEVEDSCLNVNIVLNMSSVDESILGASDGSAAVVASGGTAPYTYLWSNSMISSSMSGLSPGTYSVTVTDDAGCSSIDSVVVGYGQPSIQVGEINSSAFVLYPNPFQNQLFLNTNFSGEIELSLFNLSGELICFSNSKKINTKSLKSGVYLIKVALGEKIYRQRVFKY